MNIEAEVVEVLKLFSPEWDGNLDTQPALDSLMYLEVMFELEDRFSIEFPDEAVDLSTTPRQLVAMIQKERDRLYDRHSNGRGAA